MRLLQNHHDDDFRFTDYSPSTKTQKYAILSHTWGEDSQEVTFGDINANLGKEKTGYGKLRFCAKQVLRDELEYFWVDTCCIDKANSTELYMAINSMFRWYEDAEKCYVFLSDVSTRDRENAPTLCWLSQFEKSRWFTRGWTLQELLAPKSVDFFSAEGDHLGDKHSLVQFIHDLTGISSLALKGNPLFQFSPEEKMSWASERVTKEGEDAAYCLMGLFGIYMPLIYGEGKENAVKRLKTEIQSSIYPPSFQKGRGPKQRKSLKSKETLPNLDFRMPLRTHRDPSRRHLIRFHEALVLLYTLGRAQNERRETESCIEEDITSLPVKALRRKFLADVAYICDYNGDGRTTTAIALEEKPQGYIFWVASSTSPEKMIISFMRSLLSKIAENSGRKEPSASIAARAIFRMCIEFANPQIEVCRRGLLASSETCLDRLDEAISNEVLELVEWLRSWACQDSPTALCYFAYKNLRSNAMRKLSTLSKYPSRGSKDRAQNPFELCIYHIQRLGRIYLTAATMLSCGQRLPELRNNYLVEGIATPPEASLPPLDTLTNLESIAVRMHPSKSPQLDGRQQALREMNASAQLFQHFQKNYTSRVVKPHVHPEIQVLEWFHASKRLFAADDPFIACSRPACICCQLYFRHHPGCFVEPFSDGKICLSWRPHDLNAEKDYPMSEKQQKALMNAMIPDIRKDALHHIDKRSISKIEHPEAMTNTAQHDGLMDTQNCSTKAKGCTVSTGASLDLDSEFFGTWEVLTNPATCSGCILMRSTTNVGLASSGACRHQRKMSFGEIPSKSDYVVDDSDDEGGILL